MNGVESDGDLGYDELIEYDEEMDDHDLNNDDCDIDETMECSNDNADKKVNRDEVRII